MTLIEKQAEIIAAFKKFSSWEQKYEYIIKLGKSLAPMPETLKTEQNKVRGCQSQVWLSAQLNGEQIIYQADSDAVIVKGLAALLVSVFSQRTPQEILGSQTDFLSEIGLTQHLSQSRSNGLAAMVKQFKNYAIAFQVLLNRNPSAS